MIECNVYQLSHTLGFGRFYKVLFTWGSTSRDIQPKTNPHIRGSTKMTHGGSLLITSEYEDFANVRFFVSHSFYRMCGI